MGNKTFTEQKIFILPQISFGYFGGRDIIMPPLVQKCIDSVRIHSNENRVVVITEENYDDYTDLPTYIIKKVKEGKITLTHFSDILRMNLISLHGGLWLDATVFVSRNIPKECIFSPYFTIRYASSSSKITKGRWTGFCQSGQQGCIVQTFCLDIFLAYWEKFDILIDYFLIDYIMDWGYKCIPTIKKIIDSVPFNNEGIKELDRHFNDVYSERAFSQILESSNFFKLNWKRTYKTEIEGKQTLYHAFMANEL